MSRRIILVDWKNASTEVYSNLKIFCDAYPKFSYNTLNNYLSKRKTPFENGELRIERKDIISKTTTPPRLPKKLFWEFEYGNINWQQSYRTIIERVLDRGRKADIDELVRYYGEQKIVKALTKEIAYLSDRAIIAAGNYFQLQSSQLKCYTKKQSVPKHWHL